MAELPSGTVTFLFTDIERSTESAAALGDERWADVLQTHRDVLRPAFAKHGGVEVGTEGDAFFVAFARAHNAVNAAAAGQRAHEAHPWPGESRLRVRMGLHTGEALVRGDGYVGHEVHRAKRISDAGHGGQILLSQTTADLVGTGSLIDLGSHRLKDLGEPQHIYQLVGDGLEREFPAVRSLDAFTHSLPLQRSAFIGREREIADVHELLDANRIVTLTGVGGCGKTRLALQVGAEELDHFPDGVFFVNLAPISDPEVVMDELVRSIGVPTGGGLTGAAQTGPADEVLLAHLGSRQSLLILDNCEHLVDVCADVADRILARCPSVKILATSREALRVEGEQSWSVPSLSLPAQTRDAQTSESVSLFKARARAVRKGFELTTENLEPVVEICRRLDGIPLAIEFAAARVGHLSPRQIADRLDDRFRLLTGGQRRVQRQQTLQAALDWSFELLEEADRVLLRRLSVFAGDFSIEAAEGICSDDELRTGEITDRIGSLVSKSLVDADLVGDQVRYKLLETVRAYAAQQLAQALEAESFRVRHRDWYVAWLDAIPHEDANFDYTVSRRISREEPNLFAALEWSVSESRLDIVGHVSARLWTAFLESRRLRRWVTLGLQAEDQLTPDDRLNLHIISTMNAQWETGQSTGIGIAALPDELLEGTTRAANAQGLIMRGLGRAFFAAFLRDPQMEAEMYRDLERAEELSRGLRAEWLGLAQWQRAHAEMIFGRSEAAWSALHAARRSFESSRNGQLAAAVDFYGSALAHVLGDDESAGRMWRAYRHALDTVWSDEELRPGGEAIFATLDAVVLGIDAAWSFLHERRPLVVRSGIQTNVENLVLGCAIVHAIAGDHARAAELLSCVRAKTLGSGRALPSGAHFLLYRHYRDIVRKALGAEEAQHARQRGEQLALDEALELAFAGKVDA